MHDRICTKQYSFKTEQSYLNWIKRYILFHDNRHPNELTAEDLETYHRGEKAATPACSSFKPVIITTIFWMMMFLMIMNIIGLGSAFFLPTLLCVALTIIIIFWYRDLYTDENKKYCSGPIKLDTFKGLIRGILLSPEFERAYRLVQTQPVSGIPRTNEYVCNCTRLL